MFVTLAAFAGTTFAQDAVADARSEFEAYVAVAMNALRAGDPVTAVQIGREAAVALRPWCSGPTPYPAICKPAASSVPDCDAMPGKAVGFCMLLRWSAVTRGGVGDLAGCSSLPDAELDPCVRGAIARALERFGGRPGSELAPPEPLAAAPPAFEVPQCALLRPVYTIGKDTFTAGHATAVRLDDRHVVVLTAGTPDGLDLDKAAKKVSRIELRDAWSDTSCGEATRFLAVGAVEPLLPLGLQGLLPAPANALQPLPLSRGKVAFRDQLYAPTEKPGLIATSWVLEVYRVGLNAWVPEHLDAVAPGLPLLDARGEVVGITLASTSERVVANALPALWHKVERSLASIDPLDDVPLLPHPSPATSAEMEQQGAAAQALLIAHKPRPPLPLPPAPVVEEDVLPILEARGWGDVPLLEQFAPTQRVEPQYPKDARAEGLKQTCVAMVQVEPKGKPSRIEIAGCDERLAAAVEDALARWRWGPVDSPVRVVVRFRFASRG